MGRNKQRGGLLVLAGLGLIAAGLLLVGYNFWQDRAAERRTEPILEELEEQLPERQPGTGDPAPEAGGYAGQPLPDYMLSPEMEMPVRTIRGYPYIAILSIPSLGLELPVMDDWDYHRLRINPCRYAGSAYLGNLVICAHNYRSHFGRLATVSLGDPVTLTDMDGNEFFYEVAEVTVLQPTELTEMTESGWDLTLFTCTLSSRTRVTVRCEQVG